MKSLRKIKVVITDDNVVWRTTIRKSITEITDGEIEVIAEAGNGVELINVLKSKIPDIILLDLEMPGMPGNETLHFLKTHYPNIKVIIVSQYDNALLMEDYYSSGVQGYIPKNEASDLNTLVQGIQRVAAGKNITGNYERPKFELSEIQKDIMRMKAEGKTNEEVSSEVGISGSGVNKQIGKVKKKMGIRAYDTWLVNLVKNGFQYFTRSLW